MALPLAGKPIDEKLKKPSFKKLSAGLTGRRPLPASVNMLGKAATMRGTPKPGIAPKLPHRVPRPMNPGGLKFGAAPPPMIPQPGIAGMNIPGMAQRIPNSPLPLPGMMQGAGGY